MDALELFSVWAPPGAVWSRWAKPILFAELEGTLPALDLSALGSEVEPASAAPPACDARGAVVVDLPGVDSVRLGLSLARAGCRPVPLFNSTSGPASPTRGAAAIDVRPVVAELVRGADILERCDLRPDSPPAFLLDSRRQEAGSKPAPGTFDNRWLVFPQDFPSGECLRSHGIERVLLIQERDRTRCREDLAHALLRWQEAGLHLYLLGWPDGGEPQRLEVSRPSGFGALWYRALACLRLRRSGAGGFGAVVPQPSSG